MEIRPALIEDVPKLTEIYAPYVRETAVTFDYQVPSAEAFAALIQSTLRKYPFLVAKEDEKILGYAYVSDYKKKKAYDWSVETTIYVRQDAQRSGIGSRLYEAMENYLLKQHICNLYACITYPNPASIAFHERFGYKIAAHFSNSGYKLGKWYDIVWMEKHLDPHPVPPEPFIPFPELSQ